MKRKILGWIQLALLLSAFAAAGRLQAQVTGGTLTGEVRDTTGAIVPGTKVTIKNVATGVETAETTTGEGVYFASGLIPGSYLVTAEKENFEREVLGPVTLDVSQTVRVNLVLTVGAVTQTVEVKASGEQLLQMETGDISQVISSEEIAQIPLNGRNVLSLALLSAGVTPGAPGESGAGSAAFNVNGQRDKNNLFLIDGSDNSVAVTGRSPLYMPLDAVREFTLEANSYSAEYGDVAGGVVNLTVKSGTNKWHGSAFDFIRNSAFDDTNYFSKLFNQPKNSLIQNQFGGSVGGPIKRDRTFLFADYEGTRTISSNPQVGTVPTAAERAGNFTASGLLPIYDPTSNLGPFGPGVLRSQFSYMGVLNVIPPSKINPTAAALIAELPLPNQFNASGVPLTVNNFVTTIKNTASADSVDVRLDENLSAKGTLFGRYSYRHSAALTPSIFGAPLQGGGSSSSGHQDDVVIGYTYIIRPNLINQFQFGLNRTVGATYQLNFGTNVAENFGIPNVNVSPDTSGLSTIGITGFSSLGDPIVTPVIQSAWTWNLSDKLIWTVGRNSFRFGGEYAHEKDALQLILLARGDFVFASQTTGNITNSSHTGNAVASFLTGFPEAILRDTPALPDEYFPRYALYFQDDFKATARLTLNLGVRYDILPPTLQVGDRQSNFDPATGQMLIAGQGIARGLKITDFRNIGPRLGLAYGLTSDGKTVLRSGYGIGYIGAQDAPGPANGPALNPPFYSRVQITQFPFALQPFAINSVLPPLTLQNPATPSGDIRYLPVNGRNAYSQTWNLGIQRAITGTMYLEVAYVGSRGVRLLAPININNGAPAPLADGPPSSRQPFGTALGLIETLQTEGSSNYNGLQVKVEKKFSQGLYFLASYTYSRSLDVDSNGTDSAAAVPAVNAQNPNCLQCEYGRSTFDVPQRFVSSGVYELPFGRGKHFGSDIPKGVDLALGGWQLSGIYTAQSGTPFTATISCTDVNGDTDGVYCRPNVVANPNLPVSQRTREKWFNTAAFVIPNPFAYGDSGRTTIQGPGLSNIDLGIAKYFSWGKDAAKRIQFRAEMFNAFNNVHFNPPNTNFDSGAAFGTITSAGSPRLVQFALRFEF